MDHSMNPSCAGILPADGLLATPYVPYQPNDPARYPAKRGLVRGTIYPCLDLPFHGMVNENELSDTPMHELQALGFALQELGLYLDTHVDDEDAAELYRKYAELYERGMENFRQNCGTLRQIHSVQDGRFTWIDSPWPWELSANKEG